MEAKKMIRFITPEYKERFHIPDGSYIRVRYDWGDAVLKPCKYLDDYHVQVGCCTYHICQYAEMMQKNGHRYDQEPVIEGSEAAWRVGNDRYLFLQQNDGGYGYTLLDGTYKELDGGQLDAPRMTMQEARNEILRLCGLEGYNLYPCVYDSTLEAAQARPDHRPDDTKMVRFVNTDGIELFAIPSGSHIQMDMSWGGSHIKPVFYISDDYMRIDGRAVRPIDFAKGVAECGHYYQPEPPIEGDEAAWEVSRIRYLMLKRSYVQEGNEYHYAFLNSRYTPVKKGRLGNSKMTMTEARNMLLERFGFANNGLTPMVYEDLRLMMPTEE